MIFARQLVHDLIAILQMAHKKNKQTARFGPKRDNRFGYNTISANLYTGSRAPAMMKLNMESQIFTNLPFLAKSQNPVEIDHVSELKFKPNTKAY